MKKMQKGLVGFILILMVVSCTKKETTPPTAGETNSLLLAGAKGSSFNWKLTGIQGSEGGSTPEDIQQAFGISFPACELDNVFQFSYSTSQSYQQTEGATSCTPSTDPNTIESGTWAFTDDGKTLLIDGTVNVTSTQAQLPLEPYIGYMILSGQPLSVNTLTATSLVLSYSFIDSSGTTPETVVITLTFSKS